MNQPGHAKRSLQLFVIGSVMGILIACSSGPTQGDPSWTLVRLTEVGPAVGEWEGAVKKAGATFPEGSVHLTINANSTYLFAGQSSSKVAVGTGPLEMQDGKLVGGTEQRTVTFALYDHKGKAVLFVDSINHQSGDRYQGEFTKVQ